MRVLVAELLASFRLEVPVGSELSAVAPRSDDQVFVNWARGLNGPVQPHQMWLKAIPLETTAPASTPPPISRL
jgi:hypothetical protein